MKTEVRFIILLSYPGSPYEIGEIILGSVENEEALNDCYQHPAIFRKLEWWEYLSPEQMPKYINCEGIPEMDIPPFKREVIQWKYIAETWRACINTIPGKEHCIDVRYLNPLTKEEYDQ